jgi:hypothetical protein
LPCAGHPHIGDIDQSIEAARAFMLRCARAGNSTPIGTVRIIAIRKGF